MRVRVATILSMVNCPSRGPGQLSGQADRLWHADSRKSGDWRSSAARCDRNAGWKSAGHWLAGPSVGLIKARGVRIRGRMKMADSILVRSTDCFRTPADCHFDCRSKGRHCRRGAVAGHAAGRVGIGIEARQSLQWISRQSVPDRTAVALWELRPVRPAANLAVSIANCGRAFADPWRCRIFDAAATLL